MSSYQNGQYENAITGFAGLVMGDPTNDLADNSQYWLAECYYTMKNLLKILLKIYVNEKKP